MNTLTELKDITMATAFKIGEQLSSGLIDLLGVILVLFFGWLFTTVVVYLVKKILNASPINTFSQKISNFEWFKNTLKIDIVYIITFFIKWLLYLVFLVVAAEIMQWKVISSEITDLFTYLPSVFIAIALFLVGIYIADFIKKVLQGILNSFGIVGANIIGSLVFYLIVTMFTITALNQAKVNTTVITGNLTIIIAGIILTITIAIGIGSIETIQKLLLAHYSRRKFNIGDNIKIGDIEGTIKSIENTSVSIELSDEKEVCIPIREFSSSKIEIASKNV